MALPFTVEEFLAVFARYNDAIWPAQIVSYLLGLGAVVLVVRRTSFSDESIAAVLAIFWLLAGVVYHLAFFRPINPVAAVFGALFVLQGLLLLWAGVVRRDLVFAPASRQSAAVGGALVLYAMVLYPLIGLALGHAYPASPVFGVAPCPIVIFTFGLMAWTDARMPKRLLVIPLLWVAVGTTAAVSLGMLEDLGLLVAGLAAAALLLPRHVADEPLGHRPRTVG